MHQGRNLIEDFLYWSEKESGGSDGDGEAE